MQMLPCAGARGLTSSDTRAGTREGVLVQRRYIGRLLTGS